MALEGHLEAALEASPAPSSIVWGAAGAGTVRVQAWAAVSGRRASGWLWRDIWRRHRRRATFSTLACCRMASPAARLRQGDEEDADIEAMEASSTPVHLRAIEMGLFDDVEMGVSLEQKQERRRGADSRHRVPPRWGEAGKPMNEDYEMAKRNRETPYSREGLLFRYRYTVSPKVFLDILIDMKTEDWFEMNNLPPRINFTPPHLKVLTWLRKLARNETFDTLHQLSGVPASTATALFHKLNALIVKHKMKSVIRMPEGAELERILEVNEKCGLPGCAASTDGVHFVNDKTPASALQVSPLAPSQPRFESVLAFLPLPTVFCPKIQ